MLFVQYVTLVKYAIIYSSSIIIFYHQWMRSLIIYYSLFFDANNK